MSPSVFNPWPRRTVLVLLGLALALVWVGALVTTYDAGMAVPDWPGTYGQNMFAYPLLRWLGASWDLFIEHGHRLLGSVIGLVTIGYVVVAWNDASRPWLKWAALATLALVIFQGFLGGARVLLDERFVALAHGITAPVFIAALAIQAVLTSRPAANRLADVDQHAFRAWTRAILLTAVLCYAQMMLGAWVRHTPATAPVGQFRAAVLLHLSLAVGLTLQSLLLFARSWVQPFSGAQRGLASALAALILLQVTAGASTWVLKYGWPDGFESWRWAAEHLTIERSLAQSLLTNMHVMLGYGLLVLLSAWSCSAVRWAGLYSAPGAFMILAARSAG